MNRLNSDSRRGQWIAPVLVLLVGVVAYCNSFGGPFILDDIAAIVRNPELRSMVPYKSVSPIATTISGRPVLTFTFALDYAIGRLRPEIYHATNLLIHLFAALLLYAIVRRTLLRKERWGDRFAGSATWIGAIVAAIWVAHPLDTQAVTYIVQRAESLAGFFLLAVMYCLIRAGDGGRAARWWGVAAIVACGLGMASKEIVAAAPILAMLYDRAFMAGSFKAALSRRWKLYAGMMATWGLVLLSLHTGGRETMVGFHLGVSATDYARTELNVIVRYLRLTFWPTDLVLDYYDWPIAARWSDVTWQGWCVLMLVIATIVWLRSTPWLGFLGAWFFLILAPTSSFLPLMHEAAADQRMYLPLAAVVTLVVVGGWTLVCRWKWARAMACVLGCMVIISLIWLTTLRNDQYSTAVEIWRDTVTKRPNSARAHFNLGKSLAEASLDFQRGSPEATAAETQAAQEFRISLELEPSFTASIFALGESLVELGNPRAAEDVYTQALPKYPNIAADLLVERGTLRATLSDWGDAVADFHAAIIANPRDPEPHYFLGLVYQQERDWDDAKSELEKTIELAPEFKDAQERLAQVRKIQGG